MELLDGRYRRELIIMSVSRVCKFFLWIVGLPSLREGIQSIVMVFATTLDGWVVVQCVNNCTKRVVLSKGDNRKLQPHC